MKSNLEIIKSNVSLSDHLRRLLYQWLGAGPSDLMQVGADVLSKMQGVIEARLHAVLEADGSDWEEAYDLTRRTVYKNAGFFAALDAKGAAELMAIVQFAPGSDETWEVARKHCDDEPGKHIYEMTHELWKEQEEMWGENKLFTLRLFMDIVSAMKCFEQEHPRATAYLEVDKLRKEINAWTKSAFHEILAEEADMPRSEVERILDRATAVPDEE